MPDSHPSSEPTELGEPQRAPDAAHATAARAGAEPLDLVRFYDESYTRAGTEEGMRYARWRALGAIGKADHILALCGHAGISPASTLEVGCGDGALLCELGRRRFGGRLSGLEITQAAVDIARARPEIERVELYDGSQLPFAERCFGLGVLSHVLEHVPAPTQLLEQVAGACEAVIIEVPLEANLSARRRSKRAHAAEVGHLQRLSRADARALVASSGLRILGELEDPLPLAVHIFFADSFAARARGVAKWSLRRTLHGLAPPVARRLFSVHYACLCVPARGD